MKIISEISELGQAAAALLAGDLVIFPTETVYGLGANALDATAVTKIFSTKGRPSDNPLICHLTSMEQIEQVSPEVSDLTYRLFSCYAPGPLTLILPKLPEIPSVVSAGLPTVGVRIPDHPITQEFLRLVGVPVAAPSANLSGKPSVTAADYANSDFADQPAVKYLIDGGRARIGIESTVLDVTGEQPTILRPGKITAEQIRRDLNIEVVYASGSAQTPRAPGMKYRHYAPEAPLFLVQGNSDEIAQCILQVLTDKNIYTGNVGLWLPKALMKEVKCKILAMRPNLNLTLADYGDMVEATKRLFAQLREFDLHNCNLIFAFEESESEAGHAYLNRLLKAAQS